MRNKFEYVADKCQCVYSACACVVYGACLVLVLVYSACVCASAVLVYSACLVLVLCTVLVSHQIEQLDSLASLPDGAWPTNKKASHISFQTLNQL